MKIKSRHHLRSDEVDDLTEEIQTQLGVDLAGSTFELVELANSPFDLVLVDGDPTAMYYEFEDGERLPFLTVRGANKTNPSKNVVTVDAGAISFVSDGADVMRPGIVGADNSINSDDLVVIVEETHGKALAVGRARVSGEEMSGDSGKVVDSIHHVGDEFYEFAP